MDSRELQRSVFRALRSTVHPSCNKKNTLSQLEWPSYNCLLAINNHLLPEPKETRRAPRRAKECKICKSNEIENADESPIGPPCTSPFF